MAITGETAALPASLAQLLDPRDKSINDPGKAASLAVPSIDDEFAVEAVQVAKPSAGSLLIVLIDRHEFSRECLMAAMEALNPRYTVMPFASVRGSIGKVGTTPDVVVFYIHDEDALEAATVRDIAAMREAMPDIPIVVLSDVEGAHQPNTIRNTLNSGAHGFIPTRTTGIMVAMAAIRFVKAGGTFAPLDQLLTARPERAPALPEAARQSPLTSRQMAVLSHLQQGKANKIIAHELNMSESTVKVHVRNIMRKMGATNRTQAAYKAQQLWSRPGFAGSSSA